MGVAATDIVVHIAQLFARHGDTPYDGARRESVSALEHALQCAQLAEWAQAPAPLVAAALLHDIGHFLAPESTAARDDMDDAHEAVGASFLRSAFGPGLSEPVRLHVQAKRCLVRIDAGYAARLSPASVHSLALQGGPLRDDALAEFTALPQAQDAIALRRWDDLAKEPGVRTPPLDYYLALLHELMSQQAATARIGIGSGARAGNGAIDAA
jgi:phosphonate degradation associated HDIG domain protein